MNYTKENLNEIMNKPVRLSIGEPNSDKVSEFVEGIIVHCDLAANPPHLPASAEIELESGKRRRFSFPELKRIQFI